MLKGAEYSTLFVFNLMQKIILGFVYKKQVIYSLRL